MFSISFVLLHYVSYEITKNCIDSIINTYLANQNIRNRYDISIIVVDNASGNDSLAKLKHHFFSERYSRNQNIFSDCSLNESFNYSNHIHFISAPNNLGFAKGNNLGYDYAINKLHADFVIAANNDTVFNDSNFLDEMISSYNNAQKLGKKVALIGPNIINVAGYIQNPYRDHPISKKELKRWIRNRKLWYYFLRFDSVMHICERFSFINKYYEKRLASGRPKISVIKKPEPVFDVVLHGSCIIATPEFIKTFADYLFYPETFMYCEEEIITRLVVNKGLNTMFVPTISMNHMESASTKLALGGKRKKELFFTKNLLDSLKILKRFVM